MKKNLKVLSVFFLAILLLFVSFTFLNARDRTVKVLKDVSDVFNVVGNLIVNGDVGIGTTTPSAKLTVAGTIESTTGGFKFPDGTIQMTACLKNNLVNGKHSSQDCTDKYGVLVKVSDGTNVDEAYCNTNGNCFCKFVTDSTCDNASHPGWTQHERWSTTAASSCETGKCCGGRSSCTTSSHPWQNTGRETCNATKCGCGGCSVCKKTCSATASITQVGCY